MLRICGCWTDKPNSGILFSSISCEVNGYRSLYPPLELMIRVNQRDSRDVSEELVASNSVQRLQKGLFLYIPLESLIEGALYQRRTSRMPGVRTHDYGGWRGYNGKQGVCAPRGLSVSLEAFTGNAQLGDVHPRD